MRKEILKKLENEKFMDKIINMKTQAEVKEAFKKENIGISNDELKEVGKTIYSMLDQISKMPMNLSKEELEKVSGGVVDPMTSAIVAPVCGMMKYLFKFGIAEEKTKTQAFKTIGEKEKTKQKMSDVRISEINSENIYKIALAVPIAFGSAYAIKAFVDSIRDGSLARWFLIPDEKV